MSKKYDYINNLQLEDLMLGKLTNDSNVSKNIILIRLYDEYQKIIKNKTEFTYNEVTLINLKNAYKNILEKVSNLSIEGYYSNEEILKYIKESMLMLSTYFDSFNFSDVNRVKDTISLITTLECLLKLPVSFPSSIKKCLEKELSIEQSEVKPNGRNY